MNFIPAHDSLNVYVGANGATFDTDGHIITIGENLKDVSGKTGSVRFIGGGVVTLSAAGEYTGVTMVEVGTTVHVPSPLGIGGGLAVSVPAETPATGTYSLLVCDGEGVFTAAVLDGVAAPAGATLSVSQDGKAVLCTYGDGGPVWIGGTSGSLSDAANWANNAVPGAGTNCVIGSAAPATLTVGDKFAASFITFTSDSAAVTINAANGESISGIVAITNLSLTTSHTINAPVHFAGDIQVNQAAMAETGDLLKAHVTFAGGAHAAQGYAIESGDSSAVYSRCMFGDYYLYPPEGSPWKASYQGSQNRLCLADNSVLHIPYAGDLTELYIGTGAAVTNGVVNLPEDKRLCYQNKGECVITNEFTVSGSSKKDGYAGWNAGTGAANVFKIEKATCNKTDGYTFYFAEKNGASHGTYYFGEGGINFGSGKGYFGFGKNSDNDAQTVRPWYGDFTMETGSGNSDGFDVYFYRNVTFNTDDENGNGCTITLNARPRFNYTPTFTVSGTGKVLVNSVANNEVQPPVTVTDTATLELASGASLSTGPLTLGAGTTFVVASDNLPINVASLTLPESGKATIQITGDTAYLDGDYEVFFSAAGLPAGFADKINIVLPDGTSENRRLYTTDNGTMRLLVGNGDLSLPYTWTGAADDGKMNTAGNWLGGAVPPAGAAVFIPPTAGEIVNDIENFAPKSITIGYGTDTLKIVGNSMTVGVITNYSSSAVNPELVCPIYFAETYRVHNEIQPVNFSGGATATYPDPNMTDNAASHTLMGDITFTENWAQGDIANPYTVPDGSVLRGKDARGTGTTSKHCFLFIEAGGEAHFETAFVSNNKSLINTDGELRVEGVLEVGDDDSDGYCHATHNENDTGVIYAGGIHKKSTKATYIKVPTIYIGKDGLGATEKDWRIFFADNAKTVYATADFEIFSAYTNTNPRSDWGLQLDEQVTFNTQGHTINWTGGAQGGGTLVKDGEGTLIFNPPATSLSGAVIVRNGTLRCAMNAGIGSGAITVENGGTLAVDKGMKTGTGAVTVEAGGTLAAAESGAATVGGVLTLKAGACLGFNYTTRNEPKLDLSDKTVTFEEGETTNVVVKISATADKRPLAGENVLTCGGNFSEDVALTLAAPDWVKSVYVNDAGNIAIDVKPIGTRIILR